MRGVLRNLIAGVCAAVTALVPFARPSGAGVVLSASTSPSIAVGYERPAWGVSLGADARWSQVREDVPGYGEDLTIFVVDPTLSVMLRASGDGYSRYLVARFAKEFPVGVTLDSHVDQHERERYFEDANNDYWAKLGFGLRLPVHRAIELGAEAGLRVRAMDNNRSVNGFKREWSSTEVGVYVDAVTFVLP